MRISDWSSDVCSSDLFRKRFPNGLAGFASNQVSELVILAAHNIREPPQRFNAIAERLRGPCWPGGASTGHLCINVADGSGPKSRRSEEHTSELQSLMRISYAVFCLKKKT